MMMTVWIVGHANTWSTDAEIVCVHNPGTRRKQRTKKMMVSLGE